MKWVVFVFLLVGLGTRVSGQETTTDPGPPLSTLHVYMDLIQVPVLVLSTSFEPLKKPVDPGRFAVSLDSGPAFKPKHVRVEGEDPITLGILLDMNSPESLLKRFGAAAGVLPAETMHSYDRVSVFSMDCKLLRTLGDSAGNDTSRLQGGITAAVSLAAERRLQHERCDSRTQLWDAVARCAQQLGNVPGGRRVLLLITDGLDRGSKMTWNEVKSYAQSEGVAVFAFAPRDTSFQKGKIGPDLTDAAPLDAVCQLSGGIAIPVKDYALQFQFVEFLRLVRGRYIVEFGRPRTDDPGQHSMLVTVAKSAAIVRPAGVSVVLPDPRLALDPNTIPRDETNAPELGKRKILQPPQ